MATSGLGDRRGTTGSLVDVTSAIEVAIGTALLLVDSWRRRQRYRGEIRRLMKVGPHMIADIGLTRREAEHELAKRFWQA